MSRGVTSCRSQRPGDGGGGLVAGAAAGPDQERNEQCSVTTSASVCSKASEHLDGQRRSDCQHQQPHHPRGEPGSRYWS